jgi:hypothetical protein
MLVCWLSERAKWILELYCHEKSLYISRAVSYLKNKHDLILVLVLGQLGNLEFMNSLYYFE